MKRVVLVILVFSLLLGSLFFNSNMSTVYAAADTPETVIVLDPGHDAKHGGATYYGLKEHMLVYKIALYCKAELEQYYGVKVYLTRTSNECPYSDCTSTNCNVNRVKYAQSVGADAYISMHLNADASRRASGGFVYYQNSNYRANLGAQSKELAASVMDELELIGVKRIDSGIKLRNSQDGATYPDGSLADGLVALKWPKLLGFPSILIEHVFLSNEDDVEKFLSSRSALKAVGVADATGIANYLGLKKDVSVRQAADGAWYYYVGDKVDTTFTGLAQKGSEWCYFESGKHVDSVTGLVLHNYNLWYVKDGIVDYGLNGLYKTTDGYYYVVNGKVDNTYTGLATNKHGTWYIKDGKLDKSIKGLIQIDGDWWYITKGKVNYEFEGLLKNEGDWWYVRNGKVDLSYNDIATNKYGTWFVENGRINRTKSGVIQCGEGWYLFENGKVCDVSAIEKSELGWCYIQNGVVDFSYTGVAQKESNKWYYVESGIVDFAYDGVAPDKEGNLYYVENGKVYFTKQGILKRGDNYYLFKDGKVQLVDTIEKKSSGKWYVIKNGQVDFSFEGIASNTRGMYYCQKGKVNFDFTGTVEYEGYTYKVVKGRAKLIE